MAVWRRTLYCKLGQTGQVCERLKEIASMAMDADPSITAYRVYTDLSGKTDRVITEIERNGFEHPRELSRRLHSRPEALEILRKMVPSIEMAEVEFLDVELSLTREERE